MPHSPKPPERRPEHRPPAPGNRDAPAPSRSTGDALRLLFEQRSAALYRIATLLTGDADRGGDLVVVLFRRLADLPGLRADLTLVQLVRSMWVIVSRGEPAAYDPHHVVALAASGELSLSEISEICELSRHQVSAMLRTGLASEFEQRALSDSTAGR
jgi:hypothetical protein